ncbi:MAG: copper resistance protein B [Thermomonas sp.]|uniref:copper resistance protein B n=1 Tax=Thermomonas sp. TaxID=1971895 RepID=UPI0039E6D904
MRRIIATALLLCIANAALAQDHAQHQHHSMQEEKTPDARVRGDDAQKQDTATYRPPALTDADRAAAFPDLHGHDMSAHMDDDPFVWMVSADRLEWQQDDAAAWEASAWSGHDTGRLWLRSEGEREHGNTGASIEALWGKPVNAWWDVLAGIRHDTGHGPSRDWLAVGVQGLAPYKFEVSATAYLGNGGRSMLQAQAEYDVLLTNKLILQPVVEVELHGRDDVARGIGSGPAHAEAGLRLRYEIRREFAPYVGYQWSRSFGGTADFARAAGEPVSDGQWIAGLRFWF